MQRLRTCKGVPPYEHLTIRQQDHDWSMRLSWKDPTKVRPRQCSGSFYPSPSGLPPNSSWRCHWPQNQITLPTSDQISALSYARDSSWYSICSNHLFKACSQTLQRTSWSCILYMPLSTWNTLLFPCIQWIYQGRPNGLHWLWLGIRSKHPTLTNRLVYQTSRLHLQLAISPTIPCCILIYRSWICCTIRL